MKLLIVVLLGLFNFCSIYSQKIMLKTGFGYSRASKADYPYSNKNEEEELSYPNLGIAKEWKISKNYSLQSGINITKRAYRTEVYYIYRTGQAYNQYYPKLAQYYWEVPLQFKMAFGKNKIGVKKLSINIGGYMAYNFKNRFHILKGTHYFPQRDFTLDTLNKQFNSKTLHKSLFDYGLNIGLSYNFSNSPLSMEVKYNHGLVGQRNKTLFMYDKIYSPDDFWQKIHNRENKRPDVLKANKKFELAIYYQLK